jgi:hypothetical protein
MILPGSPHLLLPGLVELTWTIAFLISLASGLESLRQVREDRRSLKASGLNGPATIEANIILRDAIVRILVSVPSVALGAWALLTPDVPLTTNGLFFAGCLEILAVVYGGQGALDLRDKRRQLHLLRKSKHLRRVEDYAEPK